MTIRHLSQSIAGLLRNNPVGTLDFVLDDEGKPLSDEEARIRLNEMLDQGQKLLPTNSDCVGFDPVKGCPGHEPLTGSDLTRAMLKRGDACAPCFVSDKSDIAAIEGKLIEAVVGCGICFESAQSNWDYAVAINPKIGEPYTAQEAGL